LAIFLLIIIITFIFWPWISKWLKVFMAHRAEDMVRRMTGMPSRKEEEKRRRQQEKRESSNGRKRGYGYNTGFYDSSTSDNSIKNMQRYAEDVEFTETIEYSGDSIPEDDNNSRRVYRESQVSDAEYDEIKYKER